MPTNGHPPAPQPPVPRNPQPARPPPRQVLHPEAETLAFGYSDLLMELDQARAKIGDLQRQLDGERRERLYWKDFVRKVAEAGMHMLRGDNDQN